MVQPRPALDGPAPRIDSVDLNHQTGRWGEELVFSYLQWQLAAFRPCRGIFCDLMYECPSTGWQVEWINYKEETRKPFDIRLRYQHFCRVFCTLLVAAESLQDNALCCAATTTCSM